MDESPGLLDRIDDPGGRFTVDDGYGRDRAIRIEATGNRVRVGLRVLFAAQGLAFDSQHTGNLQHSLAIGAVDDHQELAAGRYR